MEQNHTAGRVQSDKRVQRSLPVCGATANLPAKRPRTPQRFGCPRPWPRQQRSWWHPIRRLAYRGLRRRKRRVWWAHERTRGLVAAESMLYNSYNNCSNNNKQQGLYAGSLKRTAAPNQFKPHGENAKCSPPERDLEDVTVTSHVVKMERSGARKAQCLAPGPSLPASGAGMRFFSFIWCKAACAHAGHKCTSAPQRKESRK
jgi:hypothetical protein